MRKSCAITPFRVIASLGFKSLHRHHLQLFSRVTATVAPSSVHRLFLRVETGVPSLDTESSFQSSHGPREGLARCSRNYRLFRGVPLRKTSAETQRAMAAFGLPQTDVVLSGRDT